MCVPASLSLSLSPVHVGHYLFTEFVSLRVISAVASMFCVLVFWFPDAQSKYITALTETLVWVAIGRS